MMQTKSRLPQLAGTLIFEATWAGTVSQKLATLGISAAFWTIWVTMWLPLITAFVWFVAPVYGVAQALPAWRDAAMTLGLILATGFAMGAFLGLWGALQTIIGQNTPRPLPTADATLEELAEWHKLEAPVLLTAWHSRRLVIHHDENGQVTHIESSLTGPLPELAPAPAARAGVVLGAVNQAGIGNELATSFSEAKTFEPEGHAVINGVLVWEPPEFSQTWAAQSAASPKPAL